MNDVTHLLSAIEDGDVHAAEQLLPAVYDDLRRLAAKKMAQEAPGHSLEATALVHEAYVRLVNTEEEQEWHHRGHFFAAAAEAMRRILVENARRKQSQKRGGNKSRQPLEESQIVAPGINEDLVALDEALDKLAEVDADAAKLVQLRYFTGLTISDAAELLNMSDRSANRLWAFARAWLKREIQDEPPTD